MPNKYRVQTQMRDREIFLETTSFEQAYESFKLLELESRNGISGYFNISLDYYNTNGEQHSIYHYQA